MTSDEQKQQMQMASDILEIKQAVIGDPSIGLPGLVSDVKELKQFRQNIGLKTAGIAGAVSALLWGGKSLWGKLFQ